MTVKSGSGMVTGSDNVFKDLGFDTEEATNLKIRADLMIDLCNYIESQGWTQQETAQHLGEAEIKISNLMKGEIEQFNVDNLISMLGKLGKQVRVEVTL